MVVGYLCFGRGPFGLHESVAKTTVDRRICGADKSGKARVSESGPAIGSGGLHGVGFGRTNWAVGAFCVLENGPTCDKPAPRTTGGIPPDRNDRALRN